MVVAMAATPVGKDKRRGRQRVGWVPMSHMLSWQIHRLTRRKSQNMTHHYFISHVRIKLTEVIKRTNTTHFLNLRYQ